MGLKIAFVTTWRQKCGIASYSENLARAISKLGAEVYIVRIPRFGQRSPELFQGIVDSIPVDKVDLIHCQHEYGLWTNFEKQFFEALRRLGKPIVTTMHSVGNFMLDREIISRSDRVIVHNEFCARRLEGPSVIIPHGSLGYVKCPPAAECKDRWGIQAKAPIVGYLGYISAGKRVDVLVEAMRAVPNAGLMVAGGWFTEEDTEYINKTKEWSLQMLPSRCQWTGYVPDDLLPIAYGAMDIVVYPPRLATESGALITALSHGKATIASQLPPFVEKEKKGALMTFTDAEDLSEKIRQLLKDNGLRKKLEAGARKYAEETRWFPNVAKLHLSLYESTIAKRKALGGKN